MSNRLTKKQHAFVKEYLETGNGTKSALKAYNTNDYSTAGMIASENLKKPKIIEAMENEATNAFIRIVKISKTAKNESVKLNANKDILDRAGYKPIERQDITSQGEKIIIIPNELIEIDTKDIKEAELINN